MNPGFCWKEDVLAARTSRLPSADDATEDHCAPNGLLATFQVFPESGERQMEPEMPPETATNLLPSAEEATEVQDSRGALPSVQFVPELLER